MNKSESIKELATALCKFQAEVEGAKRKATNTFFTRNGKALKYADLEEVWNTIREPLTDNGLSVIQTFVPGDLALVTIPEKDKAGNVTYHDCNNMTVIIQTMLMHTSGEWIKSDGLRLPITKNDPQQMGSAITYGRRYDLTAFLGIYQEDDDGNSHTINPPNKPDKNSPLEKAKDAAVKEIKAKYKATDNWILDIDNCKSEQSIKDVILSCKTEWERKNKPETEESVKADIVKGWNALKYTLAHQGKSVKKYLEVDGLSDCHDIDNLIAYREHLRNTYKEQQSTVAGVEGGE